MDYNKINTQSEARLERIRNLAEVSMKRLIKLVLLLSVTVCLLAGCMPAGTEPITKDLHLVQLDPPKEGQEMAVMTTNKGVIKFILYEEYAPKTVKQFKTLVEEGFYNNNSIYATQKDICTFLTGSSDGEGNEGKVVSDDGKKLPAETTPDLWHFSGAVSAYGESSGILTKQIKSDSRFFILGDRPADTAVIEELEKYSYPEAVINAYKDLGGVPLYTGQFTVFGQVIEGMDVVNAIIASETKKDENGNVTPYPKEDLIVESIELTTYSSQGQ